MNCIRQLCAALALLAWIGASAHVVLEHGGQMFGSHATAAEHDGHHHGHGPHPDGAHHHDLGATVAPQSPNHLAKLVIIPQWLPLEEQLAPALVAVLLGADLVHQHSVYGDSPPDSRLSGWLLVVHSALPVRAPSLPA